MTIRSVLESVAREFLQAVRPLLDVSFHDVVKTTCHQASLRLVSLLVLLVRRDVSVRELFTDVGTFPLLSISP